MNLLKLCTISFLGHLVTQRIFFVIFIFAVAHIEYASAQTEGATGRLSQFGAFTGKILPKSIPGANEIFSLSGVRYSHPTGKSGFLDFGGIFGNGEGVKWQGAFLGVSMRIPVETLTAHAGLGLDYTRYEANDAEAKNIGGAHFIGGLMTELGENVLIRFDMKLNSKPGTSLFFGIGLVIEMDLFSGGGGSDNS